MAYWLASERRGQESSFMQRFDARFWTVNFPRPAMASVIALGESQMRVDVELHNKDELVGVIWDSVDTLDHPLLAYETSRDYSNTTVTFNWRSFGLIPLDQPNGPTLTIEGRDSSGTPQTWYIRLWNYATGTPTNANISLPFSQLESGYSLPGTAINSADIDRMFISIVAPEYDAGSSEPLSQPFTGTVRITNINSDGANSMLELGDVLLPVHGERMATAYDDAYNQTPERLIRSMIGLGYREDFIHYVGMSHFMRLERNTSGDLLVKPEGEICRPAEFWHRALCQGARDNDLEPIFSISYELFDAYCPEDWKQRTYSGDPALTGWIPPSTLLSPANTEAMQWLQSSTAAFIGLIEFANRPVRVQIGEPWWWVTTAGEICLYDDAARQAFGGAPAEITDMRASLNAVQIALLDQAGELLAHSTADLTQAVRDAATEDAEVLLLAFTPTILNPEMPELFRANMPTGWAAPAFDRLQLEDYDWLTGGADALRRAAYTFVDARLGYQLADQDYLAGFVLDPVDAELFWSRIDRGLDEAAERGIPRRYVWALPQVSRDGYTRLPPTQEEDMNAFDDVLYPFALGRNTAVAPEFSTSVSVTASGHEQRNSLWSDARIHFDVGPGIRSEAELAELIAFFRARRGAARGFRVSDPFDHSSNGMTGTPTMIDQLIGTGDGVSADFQLTKSYGEGSEPQLRLVTRPRIDTLSISVDGAINADWALGERGLIQFANAPAFGAEIRAGFLFDVPVRFAEDRIDVSGVNFAAGEAPSIPLIELREDA
uniref:DUF2460 domain-containing protein n=1 Tax=uncultured Erythrobacter sp. TaxID=263913 RepID=UPI00261306BB|nr:DUF2460 domain-containing protein [uncultured Erythrobacter sp.]